MNIAVTEDRGSALSRQILGVGLMPRYSPTRRTSSSSRAAPRNKDVWRMTASGGLPTQLTTDPKDDEDPCYSPGGKQIVFTSKRTGNQDLWVMTADGGNQRQLTSGTGG